MSIYFFANTINFNGNTYEWEGKVFNLLSQVVDAIRGNQRLSVCLSENECKRIFGMKVKECEQFINSASAQEVINLMPHL